jgi:D-alanyl-D-alanine carboxypeptidase
MRQFLSPFVFASLLAPAAALAEPSIIATDVSTGIILSSNNIDVKQDPYLTGKLALLFIGLNDVVTGEIDPDRMVEYPDGSARPFALVLKDAASDSLSSPISITLVAGHVAQSPAILNERMTALFRKIGMRATKVETIRTRQGEPSWSGFTTNRDIARLTTALLLTHKDHARKLLPQASDRFQEQKGNWIYRDGMCLNVTSAASTGRELVSVIQGASSEVNCASATEVAIRHNDNRIDAVSKKMP